MTEIKALQEQHKEAVNHLQKHIEIITRAENRIGYLTSEISCLDSEAVKQATDAFKQGKNIDWQTVALERLTLERELSALPLVVERLKEQTTALKAETRRLAEAVTDAESEARELSISGKIKELLSQGMTPESVRSELGLDNAEFIRLRA